MINNPRSERAKSCADRDVNMIVAIERRGRANSIESQRNVEPALRVAIEITTGIGDVRSVRAGSAIDGRRVAVERIQINNPSERIAGGIENSQYIIHRFEDEPITCTQTLVRRFDRKLIATVGSTLVVVVQPIEGQCQFGIRFCFSISRQCRADADLSSNRAVDDLPTAQGKVGVSIADQGWFYFRVGDDIGSR